MCVGKDGQVAKRRERSSELASLNKFVLWEQTTCWEDAAGRIHSEYDMLAAPPALINPKCFLHHHPSHSTIWSAFVRNPSIVDS